MPAPAKVQVGKAITAFDSTDATVTLNVTAGNLLVALINTYAGNPAGFTYSDSQTNTYTSRGSTYTDPIGARVMTAVAGSSGSNTFTFGKGGGTVTASVVLYEISGWDAGPTDPGDATFANGANGTDSSVTMGSSTTVATDLLLTWLGTREVEQVTAGSPNTTNASFVNDQSQSNASGYLQTETAIATTSSTAAFTGGWPAMTNSNGRPWQSGIIAIKGASTAPVISSTDSPVAEGGDLTVTGTNLKAAGNSTATINGTAQTVKTQSATTPVITVDDLGAMKFSTDYDLVITDSTSAASNAVSVQITPPSGYAETTLSGYNSAAAGSVTAIPALADGDQIEWDTASLVTIDAAGIIGPVDPSITSFQVRANDGTGWGAWATQLVNSATWSDIPGATNATLVLGSGQSGKIIRVVATATNDAGTRSKASDETGTVS